MISWSLASGMDIGRVDVVYSVSPLTPEVCWDQLIHRFLHSPSEEWLNSWRLASIGDNYVDAGGLAWAYAYVPSVAGCVAAS